MSFNSVSFLNFTAKKLPKGEQGAGPGQGQGTRLTDREAPRAAANCCK